MLPFSHKKIFPRLDDLRGILDRDAVHLIRIGLFNDLILPFQTKVLMPLKSRQSGTLIFSGWYSTPLAFFGMGMPNVFRSKHAVR